MMAWFSMGGYGGYVWAAFGATGLVLLAYFLVSWRRHRRLLRQLHLQLTSSS